jgi:hypothetical protein
MLNIILGGILAILGGIIGTWLQSKYARKIRMNQIIAEKRVTANEEAYVRMKIIESILHQGDLKIALAKIAKDQEWLIRSRLYLPGRFPDMWFEIRNTLDSALELERKLSISDKEKAFNEIQKVKKRLQQLSHDSIIEIYKDMKLKPIELQQFKD